MARMRRMIVSVLLLMMLAASAMADVSVTATPEVLSIGGTVMAAAATEAERVRYEILLDGQSIFQGEETAQKTAAFRPRKAGKYTLIVTAKNAAGKEETGSASFLVTESLSCTLDIDRKTVRTGEPLRATAQVSGGAAPFSYLWTIYLDGNKTDCIRTQEPSLLYTAKDAGRLTVKLQVTCGQLGFYQCQSGEIEVTEGKGITVSGNDIPIFRQGGAYTWVVHAPGVWQASVDAAWVTLENTCGVGEDTLTLNVKEGDGHSRKATLSIESCGKKVRLPVFQASDYVEEREVYFEPVQEPHILIDGAAEAVWNDASGTRIFKIDAPEAWTATCDADFLALTIEGDTLHVALTENDTAYARRATVSVSDGTAQGQLYISQGPKTGAPAVRSLELSADQGTAYQTILTASVLTDAHAEYLTLQCGSAAQLIRFEKESAVLSDGALLWRVDVPVDGESGAQTLLFRSGNAEGIGNGACAMITVASEAPDFAQETAKLMFVQGKLCMRTKTTAAAAHMEALDKDQKVIKAYTREDAATEVLFDGETRGRWANWTIPVEKNAVPAYLRIGERVQEVPQSIPSALAAITAFDQCDGWWADKKYRTSTLEESGCAIFTLSAALEALGYADTNHTPEALAKKYAFCLVDGGTLNSTLVGNAGDDLGFKTRYTLYERKDDVLKKMKSGALFSFSVVSGHIALINRVSDDGRMFHIVDSALSATFSRIQNARMYRVDSDTGEYIAISDLCELPGATYYMETNAYGGGEYWLESDYVLKRGVRLIEPDI